MALSRKLLESMGLDSDKVSTIIEAHAETVDSLKNQINTYKNDAEQLAEVKAQLDSANAELEGLKKSDWQAKYEQVEKDFEAYKTSQIEKDNKYAKENAYKELLKQAGVSDKRIDSIVKVTDLNAAEFENGKFKDEAAMSEAIKADWGDFIIATNTQGANTTTPPENNGPIHYTKEDIKNMSRDEINKNWSAITASLASKGE